MLYLWKLAKRNYVMVARFRDLNYVLDVPSMDVKVLQLPRRGHGLTRRTGLVPW